MLIRGDVKELNSLIERYLGKVLRVQYLGACYTGTNETTHAQKENGKKEPETESTINTYAKNHIKG